jgi:hypothetical protein
MLLILETNTEPLIAWQVYKVLPFLVIYRSLSYTVQCTVQCVYDDKKREAKILVRFEVLLKIQEKNLKLQQLCSG